MSRQAREPERDEAEADEEEDENPRPAPAATEQDEAGEEGEPPSEKPRSPASDRSEAAPSSRRRRLLSYGLQLLAVLALVWAITWYQARRLLPTRAEAPPFALTSLTGESHRLADARGRKVVLYFFAPWCTVCEFSSHNVTALRNARSDRELAIFAVGLGWDEEGELARFAAEHELNVPVLKGDAQVQRAYRVDTFPSIYVIDEQGRIADRVVGYTTELGLRLRSL